MENKQVILQRLKDDFKHYALRALKIRGKEGGIIHLSLNKAQLHIHNLITQQKNTTGKVRAIILKGRQQGCSTYVEGRFFWLVQFRFGVRAFILTHDAEATNNLFDMAKRFYENCPDAIKPSIEASNAKELIFGKLDSGYKLGTAGNKAVGRSSTIQLLHGSEVAFWPNAEEHAKGILQAVPNEKGTEIIIESTANGITGYFYEQWQKAESQESEFIPIFIPWFWQEEYRVPVGTDFKLSDDELALREQYNLSNEQINWRRVKISELSTGGADGFKSFYQEYPCCPLEAFQTNTDDSFCNPSLVIGCTHAKYEQIGPLVIGVDPAGSGDDRTSIIRRRGRVAFGLESYHKKNTMEVVAIVYQIIIKENPVKVFVDYVGIGNGIYDRLAELLGENKDILVPVNGGSTPLNKEIFYNKRAEMWGNMRSWLSEGAQIPNVNSLMSDLCGVKYRYDNVTRYVLESKRDMKKRGIRSPDEADALALTFALPANAIAHSEKKSYQELAKSLMSGYNQANVARRKAYRK